MVLVFCAHGKFKFDGLLKPRHRVLWNSLALNPEECQPKLEPGGHCYFNLQRSDHDTARFLVPIQNFTT